MPEAMKEAPNALLQTDDKMHSNDAIHSPFTRDTSNTYNTKARAFWNDSNSGTVSNNKTVCQERGGSTLIPNQKRALEKKQHKHQWYVYQSNLHTK